MRALTALAPLALALPAAAKDGPERDAFDCGVMRTCMVGEPCISEDRLFGALEYLDDTEIALTLAGDAPRRLRLDPETGTAAFAVGNTVMQFTSTGDGGAIVTQIPRFGDPDRTQVLFLHCSPP